MKKTFRVLTSLAMAMVLVIFTGCGNQTVTQEQTSQKTAIGNPWSDWETIEAAEVAVCPDAMELAGNAEIITLTSADPHDCNTYEEPEKVHLTREVRAFDGKVTVPAYSVVSVVADVK